MPKKEPTPDKEPKEETTSGEESGGEPPFSDKTKKKNSSGMTKIVIGAAVGAAVGAGVALVGIPLCMSALGFTEAGIATGSVTLTTIAEMISEYGIAARSIAAMMMSPAAIANGGGVAAGSTVAVLQWIGDKVLSAAAKIGLTYALKSIIAAAGALLSKWKKPPSKKPKEK